MEANLWSQIQKYTVNDFPNSTRTHETWVTTRRIYLRLVLSFFHLKSNVWHVLPVVHRLPRSSWHRNASTEQPGNPAGISTQHGRRWTEFGVILDVCERKEKFVIGAPTLLCDWVESLWRQMGASEDRAVTEQRAYHDIRHTSSQRTACTSERPSYQQLSAQQSTTTGSKEENKAAVFLRPHELWIGTINMFKEKGMHLFVTDNKM